MSFSVLVIPEDPLQNGHILKPLVQAIMREVGRPRAKVKLLTQPRVRGYDQAVNTIRNKLTARYGFTDLWLFFPDADRTSRGAMRDLEAHVAAEGVTLLCCAAQPEVEIYNTGRPDPKYFRLWEHVGRSLGPGDRLPGGKPKPETVYREAEDALLTLAGEWKERFKSCSNDAIHLYERAS